MFNSTLFPLLNAKIKMSGFFPRLITAVNFSLLDRTRNSPLQSVKRRENSQPVLHPEKQAGRIFS